jgi:hypothetical protein
MIVSLMERVFQISIVQLNGENEKVELNVFQLEVQQ